MKTKTHRHHFILVTQLCISCVGLYACMHKKSQQEFASGVQSNVPGWLDLSTNTDGKTRQLCPAQSSDGNDDVQCAFKDSSTGLIWSSRAPGQDGFREAREYLTWSEAKSACEKLGQWSGMDGWRLPTEAELNSAFLTPSGSIRQSGLLGLTDRIASFGPFPKYSLIWSLNEDAKSPNQAKALLRGGTNISMGTVAKDMARGWHCVHSSATAVEPQRAVSASSIPLTAAPTDTAPQGDRPRLPPVKPEPPSAADVKASSILGQSNTGIAAPKWTIQPINDFDRLSFILTANDKLPAPPGPAAARRDQGHGAKLSADATLIPSGIPSGILSEIPLELPTNLTGQKKSTPFQQNFIKALRLAFAKLGLAHAIDDHGRLILNKASGIRFPSGEGNLSKSSLPRAKIMLRTYTEVLLAELPESAATARLAVVGYSIPSLRMNPTATQQANKKISRTRAERIRTLITDFNIWPPDQISIDGLGNVSPIERKDRVEGECGIYDCDLSRRVEVSPIFKESTKTK